MRFWMRLCPGARFRALILTTTVSMGCGSLASTSIGTPSDAGAPADGFAADAGDDAAQDAGSPEAGAIAPCDGGGYFIMVGDDAGCRSFATAATGSWLRPYS